MSAGPVRRWGRGASERDSVLVGLAWISPWLVGFVVFMAIPIAMSLWYSLTDFPLLEPPLYVGAENYTRLLRDEVFGKALWNTALFCLMFIPAASALSLLIAAALNQRLRGLWIYRTAVFIPSLVPIVAAAMIWLWLFNADQGLINVALRSIGIDGPNWLGDRRVALAALVLMSLWNIGQPVVIYLAALQDVPRSLYEAASIDGMGAARRLWHVTMPMISPVILFNVIIMTINTLQVFAVPFIMTEGGPDRATYLFTHYLYDNAFVFRKMGYACAIAWVQFVVILALTGVMFAASRRLVHYRAG